MTLFKRIRNLIDIPPLPHRPPLPKRHWFYSMAAYLMPVVAQVVFPDDPTMTDELVWLVTLVPAFLLALHYGVRGAVVALFLGTTLFVVVQVVVAVTATPDDWRITVPIYVTYGTLTISVGWLSEQIGRFYERPLRDEPCAIPACSRRPISSSSQ